MSRFPHSFYALGRRWARPDAERANWSLPSFEDAAQALFAVDMPWNSDEARRAFAELPEVHGRQGWKPEGPSHRRVARFTTARPPKAGRP